MVQHRPLLEAQPKGRALDVAAGRGRNSFLLAELGFDVDAVDVSDAAVRIVARRARERGAAVRGVRADVVETPFPRPPYEVIVNASFLERSLFRRFEEALAPGGLVVFETFTRDHAESAGGNIAAEHALARGELRDAFPALDVLDYREAVVDRDLGPGRKAVASLVARRR